MRVIYGAHSLVVCSKRTERLTDDARGTLCVGDFARGRPNGMFSRNFRCIH